MFLLIEMLCKVTIHVPFMEESAKYHEMEILKYKYL